MEGRVGGQAAIEAAGCRRRLIWSTRRPHGSVVGAAEQLLVEVVAPPPDGLGEREARRRDVHEELHVEPGAAGSTRSRRASPPRMPPGMPRPPFQILNASGHSDHGSRAHRSTALVVGDDVVDPRADQASGHAHNAMFEMTSGSPPRDCVALRAHADRGQDAEGDQQAVEVDRSGPRTSSEPGRCRDGREHGHRLYGAVVVVDPNPEPGGGGRGDARAPPSWWCPADVLGEVGLLDAPARGRRCRGTRSSLVSCCEPGGSRCRTDRAPTPRRRPSARSRVSAEALEARRRGSVDESMSSFWYADSIDRKPGLEVDAAREDVDHRGDLVLGVRQREACRPWARSRGRGADPTPSVLIDLVGRALGLVPRRRPLVEVVADRRQVVDERLAHPGLVTAVLLHRAWRSAVGRRSCPTRVVLQPAPRRRPRTRARRTRRASRGVGTPACRQW